MKGLRRNDLAPGLNRGSHDRAPSPFTAIGPPACTAGPGWREKV